MKITDFINLYENSKPKEISLPNIKAKEVAKYLKIFNNAFQKKRNLEGRGPFMKFLSDLEYLYNNLNYTELKDKLDVSEEDINDIKVFYDNVNSFIKSKDDIIDRLKERKHFEEFKEKMKVF